MRQPMPSGNISVIGSSLAALISRCFGCNSYNPTLRKKIAILPARFCWHEQYFLADRHDCLFLTFHVGISLEYSVTNQATFKNLGEIQCHIRKK
jgi:hypothetical protein